MQFYTDVINAAVFDTPVAYLQKYSQIQDYAIIIKTEDAILTLLYEIVAKNIDKAAKISSFLSQQGLDERIVPYIAKIISHKLTQIRQTLLRKEISRGGPCLLDNNWRIVVTIIFMQNIVSTNWNANTSKIMLNLTLII